MSRQCGLCRHPERSAIDQAILGGEPIRRIAARFTLPESNLHRHKPHTRRNAATANSLHGVTSFQTLDIPKQLSAINAAVLDALHTARGRGDVRAQVLAAGAALRQLEFSHTLEVDAANRELEQRVQALEQALQATTIARDSSHSNGAGHWSGVA